MYIVELLWFRLLLSNLFKKGGIISIIRGRGTALRLPHGATARVRPYILRRYERR
jgi:hypothetical protein